MRSFEMCRIHNPRIADQVFAFSDVVHLCGGCGSTGACFWRRSQHCLVWPRSLAGFVLDANTGFLSGLVPCMDYTSWIAMDCSGLLVWIRNRYGCNRCIRTAKNDGTVLRVRACLAVSPRSLGSFERSKVFHQMLN